VWALLFLLPLLTPSPHARLDGGLCRGTVYNRRENGLLTQQYLFTAGFDSNTCKHHGKNPCDELMREIFLEEKLGKMDLFEMPVTSRPARS